MDKSKDEITRLLHIAEEKLIQLHQEKEEFSKAYYELMEGHKAEAEQMVQLTEQIWALEEALAMSREEAMAQLGKMKLKFNEMNEHMQATLEAAAQNASSMELAARVYEMSQTTDLDDIDKQINEFNQQLKPGTLGKT